jgi:hypothetical protein
VNTKNVRNAARSLLSAWSCRIHFQNLVIAGCKNSVSCFRPPHPYIRHTFDLQPWLSYQRLGEFVIVCWHSVVPHQWCLKGTPYLLVLRMLQSVAFLCLRVARDASENHTADVSVLVPVCLCVCVFHDTKKQNLAIRARRIYAFYLCLFSAMSYDVT